MSKKKHRRCANFLTTGCRNIVTSKKRTAICGECRRLEEAERPETPAQEAIRIAAQNERLQKMGLGELVTKPEPGQVDMVDYPPGTNAGLL